MFMGFLDASKAFDRLKHSLLFEKLIDRNVPGYIIRIMMYCYASQTMYVGPTMVWNIVAWISCCEWCTTRWHSISMPI